MREMVPNRYVVSYDNTTKTYRIFDAWHESYENVDFEPDMEISDDSPAVTLLTDGEAYALIDHIKLIGKLPSSGSVNNINTAKKEVKSVSEGTLLKEHAIDKIAQIAGMGAIEELGKKKK
jgi:hypothetical protein